MPIIRRRARPTLTAVEMDRGDVLEFTLTDGTVRSIELAATSARVVRTTLQTAGVEEDGGRTDYRFTATLRVDGTQHVLEREVSTQASFYDPWLIAGMHIWFDAVQDIFAFIAEVHGECRPQRHARFALQDAALGICPEPLHPWCPLPEGGLRIDCCYRGEDCWLGAYNGASAHGGLDINHPPGTPIWAPVDIHDHGYFHSLAMGHNNNRWRGIHQWPDGSTWVLQVHHMTALTVAEHAFIPRGAQFARGAGVLSGAADHSHFVFKVADGEGTILLDPWILFWQMYRDQARLEAHTR